MAIVDIRWYEKRNCWCADVPDAKKKGGRRRLYLGADEGEARSRLHAYLADYYAGPGGDHGVGTESDDDLSLFSLTARFLRWAETNLSPATVETHAGQLKPFVEQHGKLRAADITPSQVEDHKARIKARGCRPRTINFFVQSIQRLLNWGVEQRLIKENPIKTVRRVSKAPPKDLSLEPETVKKFLEFAHLSEPLGDVCEVLKNTGMRVGELLKLRWEDIDFSQRLARIYEHKTSYRGEQRPRTIPLSEGTVEIIKRQSKGSDFVFTGENGEQLTYNALKCRRDHLEKKHPEMPHVNFHQFRHTFATQCARAGVPESVAQEILGHHSTMMTRYYTSTSRGELLAAVEKVSSCKGDDSDEQ